MKISLGIDAVDIKRFEQWHKKPISSLQRIFAEHEIAYCLENPTKSAERFAVRFAAKEALYKALFQHLAVPHSFFAIARLVSVKHKSGGTPFLLVNWNKLNTQPLFTNLSITHTTTTAVACVLLHDN